MPIDHEITAGDACRADGDLGGALEHYHAAIVGEEQPHGPTCLRIARCALDLDDPATAWTWILRAAAGDRSFLVWQAAASLLSRIPGDVRPKPRRATRLAVVSSYTTTQYVALLRLAAALEGIDLQIYEAPFGQYLQQIVNDGGEMYAFGPDFVELAVHAGDLALPDHVPDPDQAVRAEVDRWAALWATIKANGGGAAIQHLFVPPADAFGHLGARTPGSLRSMVLAVNEALGRAADTSVSLLDCPRLAAEMGMDRWRDDRYWHLARQAVALDALPELARHSVAVMGARLGLSRKCLVLDLDNTLWGGVIGEDGLDGIALGPDHGPRGEAFVAFQDAALALKRKGVILAVCSKNNDADARLPFEQHPSMRLTLDDIAMFVANWEPKSQNLRQIASTLNIGLDALVFADDNPVEREIVRQQVPDVDVLVLPDDPFLYVRALQDYLSFETASYTAEDAARTGQYRARAEAKALEASATSLEDFHRSLQMTAEIRGFDESRLPRIVQLIGKSNQFNLTTRRHDAERVRQFMADENVVTWSLSLSDRFADHGLVSLMIAVRDGTTLDIDTWLMSCRVIGRTVEDEMLQHLCREATARGCTTLRGTYIPTAKNALVRDLYDRFGFACVETAEDGTTVWRYDLVEQGPITNHFITTDAPAAAA